MSKKYKNKIYVYCVRPCGHDGDHVIALVSPQVSARQFTQGARVPWVPSGEV
jgi:hypothetical protein